MSFGDQVVDYLTLNRSIHVLEVVIDIPNAARAGVSTPLEVVFHLNFPMTRFIIGTRKCQSQQLGFN